jgi:hypothetical protein
MDTMQSVLHSNGVPPAKCAKYAKIAREYVRIGKQSAHVAAIMARAVYRRDAGYGWYACSEAPAITLCIHMGW